MVLDIIGGLLFGGGGGGGGGAVPSEYEFDVDSTITGGATPVGVTSTLQGGDRPVAMDLGLDDVNLDVGGTATPIRSVAQLSVTEPVVSEVDSHVDVEPIQMDLCIDVGLSRLPRARVHQPYTSRLGVTVLGVEIFGLRWSGEAETVIDELGDRPHHEGGVTIHDSHHRRRWRDHDRGRRASHVASDHGGLHVHVG